MELTSNNTIASILERHKAQLLADGLKELQNTGLRPDDLIRAKEQRSECQEFLQLLHFAVGHVNFSDIQTPERENMRVLLPSVSRERVQRGFTPERDSEFHFMLQKAIVRSALSRTHTKPQRTCRTTLAFHQFIIPARSLGDRNLSQSSQRSHRTPAARNARIVNTGSQTLARNSRFTHDRDSRQCRHSNIAILAGAVNFLPHPSPPRSRGSGVRNSQMIQDRYSHGKSVAGNYGNRLGICDFRH